MAGWEGGGVLGLHLAEKRWGGGGEGGSNAGLEICFIKFFLSLSRQGSKGRKNRLDETSTRQVNRTSGVVPRESIRRCHVPLFTLAGISLLLLLLLWW